LPIEIKLPTMSGQPVSVNRIIEEFRSRLEGIYPSGEVMQFLYILFEEYLNWPRTQVHLEQRTIIPEGKMVLFNKSLEELEKNKPIQYIIGKTWFNGTEIEVTPDVLIPRPETEEMNRLIVNENIQRQFLDLSILEIGTGSGCIAIDLKMKFPFSKITAIDSSLPALKIARINSEKCLVPIDFFQADILDSEEWNQFGAFDIIVSNPPYVLESEKKEMHSNVTDYEPDLALYVPDVDPLIFHRTIGRFAWVHLLRPGLLYLEINERFGKEIKSLLQSLGFDNVTIIRDFKEKERIVRAEAKSSMLDTSYWYSINV